MSGMVGGFRAGGQPKGAEAAQARTGTQMMVDKSADQMNGQSFWIITSVALMMAVTVSPFFSFNSSALRRVIALSMRLSPTLTTT
jgi:hypothetical protein